MSYGADQDEELAELQRRFAVLEDEARATVEKTMSTPRSTNRTQRERVAAGNVRSDNDQELAKLDEQITQLRRKHDDLAHANLEKRRELDKLNDRLQDLSREASLPSPEDNPIMKEIRELEVRLQKAVTKYEDAQEVRRTYEQIVKRLKEERIGFNNQLEARESTMRAKEADYEELLLMSHDANQSKELAKQARGAAPSPRANATQLPCATHPPTFPLSSPADDDAPPSRCPLQELAKFEQVVSEERKLREKELTERRALVAKKQEINAELERREKARRDAMAAPSSADRSTRDGARQATTTGAAHAITEADIEEEQEKIASYEAAFREIKEATGVADVNEVIQKFITQVVLPALRSAPWLCPPRMPPREAVLQVLMPPLSPSTPPPFLPRTHSHTHPLSHSRACPPLLPRARRRRRTSRCSG